MSKEYTELGVKIIELYKSIGEVKDKSTRNILYIQFVSKYFPKCFEAIMGEIK